MDRLAFFVVQNLVLRIGQLQTAVAATFRRTEEDDLLASRKDIAQERLVEPDYADRATRVGGQPFEDLESPPAGGTKTAVRDAAHDRDRLSRSDSRNWLEAAPVFISDRKPVQQVLNRQKTDPLEVGGATWAHAFEELKRRREQLVAGRHERRRAAAWKAPPYWTTIARPGST